MNGEVKDSFEIYGDKTIHPEVPDEYISGICESGIRNIHHEGCLKEWSKLTAESNNNPYYKEELSI